MFLGVVWIDSLLVRLLNFKFILYDVDDIDNISFCIDEEDGIINVLGKRNEILGYYLSD